jgi:hypothetical protein
MYDVAALHAFFCAGQSDHLGGCYREKDRGAYHWRQCRGKRYDEWYNHRFGR